MTRVLVTGANGFIGSFLCRFLAERGMNVTALMRRPPEPPFAGGIDELVMPSFDALTPEFLQGHDAVIHLAGHAHAPGMDPAQQERLFAEDVRGVRKLAELAGRAGVSRFVFVSTVKVLGKQTGTAPFDEHSRPAPGDAYSRARLAGERIVRELAEAAGMEWVVVRPVLVVGEAARGNLDTLLRWLAARRPLPLGGLQNRRSLIALEDLSELLRCCVTHPDAAGKVLLASGNETLSTTDICTALAEGLGVQPRLFRVPTWAWSVARALPATRSLQQRLAGSLHVDNSATRRLLGWQPQVSARDSLARLAARHGGRR